MTTRIDTIPALLAATAARGDGLAHMTSEGRELSYRQWHQQSDRLAQRLAGRGVRPGDRVALLFLPSEWIELAVCYIGVHKAGAISVLLSHQALKSEMGSVMESARCSGVITGATEVQFGASWTAYADDELKQGGTRGEPDDLARADGIADVIFTSGTTGTPKGVAYTHDNASFEAQFNGGAIPWQVYGGMCIHAHPPFGAGGQARIVLPLLARMPVLSLERFDPRTFCDAVEAFRIPHVSLVPAMAVELAAWADAGKYDLSSVRAVSFGSAPIAAETMQRIALLAPRAQLYNQYSSTEALPSRVRGPYDPDSPNQVGFPDHFTEISVRDVETGLELAEGHAGEVWLRTPGVSQRTYLEDPQGSHGVFVEGWTRMGDLGYLDSAGRLVLVDRIKDVINRGGIKVSPREIEEVLESHSNVAEAAVFPIPHPILGEEVGAALVCGASMAPLDELRTYYRERLPAHKMPKRIVIVSELPRTANGKLRREELAEIIDQPRSDARPDLTARNTPTEATIAAIWKSVLEISNVGVDDDLFDLGGDSLRAVRIAAEAADVGMPIEVIDIFDYPTVGALARIVDERRSRTGRSIE